MASIEKKNVYQGQIAGPFKYSTESGDSDNRINLLNRIKKDSTSNFTYVWHLGITAEPETKFMITFLKDNTSKLIRIGKTGIYEVGNTEITSFTTISGTTFLPANTIIDYVLYKEKE